MPSWPKKSVMAVRKINRKHGSAFLLCRQAQRPETICSFYEILSTDTPLVWGILSKSNPCINSGKYIMLASLLIIYVLILILDVVLKFLKIFPILTNMKNSLNN